MNPPPTLQRIITAPFRHLSPETLRECALVQKRSEHPDQWTHADLTELLRLQRAAQLRADRESERLAERVHQSKQNNAHP